MKRFKKAVAAKALACALAAAMIFGLLPVIPVLYAQADADEIVLAGSSTVHDRVTIEDTTSSKRIVIDDDGPIILSGNNHGYGVKVIKATDITISDNTTLTCIDGAWAALEVNAEYTPGRHTTILGGGSNITIDASGETGAKSIDASYSLTLTGTFGNITGSIGATATGDLTVAAVLGDITGTISASGSLLVDSNARIGSITGEYECDGISANTVTIAAGAQIGTITGGYNHSGIHGQYGVTIIGKIDRIESSFDSSSGFAAGIGAEYGFVTIGANAQIGDITGLDNAVGIRAGGVRHTIDGEWRDVVGDITINGKIGNVTGIIGLSTSESGGAFTHNGGSITIGAGADVGNITGTGNEGIYSHKDVTINGKTGNITGATTGIHSQGAGGDEGGGSVTFGSGARVGAITGNAAHGISFNYTAEQIVNFSAGAVVGKIHGGLYGIYYPVVININSYVTISGETGAINWYGSGDPGPDIGLTTYLARWSTNADGTGATEVFPYEWAAAHKYIAILATAEITAFTFTGQIGNTEFNGPNITIVMPYGTDVTALAPNITVTAGATVSPASGTAQNFSSPVVYEITAVDGVTKFSYTVTVIVAPSDADISIGADIYFGDFGSPILWRAVKSDTLTMTLWTSTSVYSMDYNGYPAEGTNWHEKWGGTGGISVDQEGADICHWLNGISSLAPVPTPYFLPEAFHATEQVAILPYGTTESSNGYDGIDISQKIVLPSVEEMGSGTGTGTWGITQTGRALGDSWWLRSPAKQGASEAYAAYVNASGTVDTNGYNIGSPLSVRPAFKLDRTRILMSSAADTGTGSKALALAAGSTLVAMSVPSGSALKLTIFDDAMSLGSTAAAAGTVKIGDTVSIPYTGATTGTDHFVSCTIANSSGNILYYGKLVNASSPGAAAGSASFTVPDIIDGNYTIRLFTEQICGDRLTDFSSRPVSISMIVDTDGDGNPEDNGDSGNPDDNGDNGGGGGRELDEHVRTGDISGTDSHTDTNSAAVLLIMALGFTGLCATGYALYRKMRI